MEDLPISPYYICLYSLPLLLSLKKWSSEAQRIWNQKEWGLTKRMMEYRRPEITWFSLTTLLAMASVMPLVLSRFKFSIQNSLINLTMDLLNRFGAWSHCFVFYYWNVAKFSCIYIYIWRIHWWNLNGMRWWYECRWLGSWFWRGMMCTWWPVLLILFSPLRFSPLASSFARSSNYFLFVSLENSIYIYIYIRSFCSRFLTSQITCVMHVKF